MKQNVTIAAMVNIIHEWFRKSDIPQIKIILFIPNVSCFSCRHLKSTFKTFLLAIMFDRFNDHLWSGLVRKKKKKKKRWSLIRKKQYFYFRQLMLTCLRSFKLY